MRAFALALLLLLAAPLAAGHGGGEFPHVNPLQVTLPPEGERLVELTFTEAGPGGRFGAGWVFVLNALVAPGAPMRVDLRPGHVDGLGEPVASWNFSAPGPQRVTTLMPVEDVYTLHFRHGGGAGNASLLFFYDQSCECAGKPIPVELPNGLVVFNLNATQGATYRATFFEPAAHTLRVALALRTDPRSHWPEDFAVLQSSQEAQVRDVGAGPVRQHELTWTADRTDRYYFFVEAVSTDRSKFDPRNPQAALASVMVTPLFEQVSAPPKAAPGAEGALLLAGLAAAAVALRLRR